MAKRATQNPQAKAAKKAAAASGTVPNATLPLAEVPTPSAEPPAEGFGVSPPQAPLSDGADEDAPEIIVGSEPETTVLNTLEAGASAGQGGAALAEQQSAEIVTPPAVQPLNPGVEMAKSYITGHGKPSNAHPMYFTPPPPDLRKKKAPATNARK